MRQRFDPDGTPINETFLSDEEVTETSSKIPLLVAAAVGATVFEILQRIF